MHLLNRQLLCGPFLSFSHHRCGCSMLQRKVYSDMTHLLTGFPGKCEKKWQLGSPGIWCYKTSQAHSQHLVRLSVILFNSKVAFLSVFFMIMSLPHSFIQGFISLLQLAALYDSNSGKYYLGAEVNNLSAITQEEAEWTVTPLWLLNGFYNYVD